jgi:hypothetical protein
LEKEECDPPDQSDVAWTANSLTKIVLLPHEAFGYFLSPNYGKVIKWQYWVLVIV